MRMIVFAAAALLAVPGRGSENRLHPQLGAGRRPRSVLLREEARLVREGRHRPQPRARQGLDTHGAARRGGAEPVGLADMGNVLIGRGKGADSVGVFNVYANSPGAIQAQELGQQGNQGFPRQEDQQPAADGARPMWPALAKANGIDPKSVTWVNVDANAKLAALAGRLDRRHHLVLQHPSHLPARAGRRHGLRRLARHRPQPLRQLDDRERRLPQEEQGGPVAKLVQSDAASVCRGASKRQACVQALVDAGSALKFDNELATGARRSADERQDLAERGARLATTRA